MEPIKFPQANKDLLPPMGGKPEGCMSLPVYTDDKICISCWKMTWRERLGALLFGRIWVYVWSGATQPPISVASQKTVFVKE